MSGFAPLPGSSPVAVQVPVAAAVAPPPLPPPSPAQLDYNQLWLQAVELAKKYNVAHYMNGYTPAMVNQMMWVHFAKVQAAATYEDTLKLIQDGLKSYMQASGNGWFANCVTVETLVTDPNDRQQIYHIFSLWRAKFLADSVRTGRPIMAPPPPPPQQPVYQQPLPFQMPPQPIPMPLQQAQWSQMPAPPPPAYWAQQAWQQQQQPPRATR